MGGVEASRRIREVYSASGEDADEHRPFIVGVTANAMESDRQKCLEVMDDYMPKVCAEAETAHTQTAATCDCG
jgi:CheY-like chemotaxis protein